MLNESTPLAPAMIAFYLFALDAAAFALWASVYVWFLAAEPSDATMEALRTHHMSMLIHLVATWQLLWIINDYQRSRRASWHPRVRAAMFAFALLLDVFVLVRAVRFLTRLNEAAWGLEVALSSVFCFTSGVALLAVEVPAIRQI